MFVNPTGNQGISYLAQTPNAECSQAGPLTPDCKSGVPPVLAAAVGWPGCSWLFGPAGLFVRFGLTRPDRRQKHFGQKNELPLSFCP